MTAGWGLFGLGVAGMAVREGFPEEVTSRVTSGGWLGLNQVQGAKTF